MDNHYEILGVNKDATTETIKKVYRLRSLSEHPDKGGNAERFALLAIAYQILSDPSERKKFDEAWEIFYESHDTEIIVTPSGYLPTAGIAFSKSFREQHAQLVEQFLKEPLDQNKSSYLKAFASDLYSRNGNVADDLFSFIKAKKNLDKNLDIGPLTPERAVEYFISFLQGDYSGNNLRDLGKIFYNKIKELEALGQEAGPELKLYTGVYEILLVAVKEKTPTEKILFSLNKITEYAKRGTDKPMSFMAPLLQSKYFRSLFSQALHYYWLSEESVLDESFTKAFEGQEATINLIERFKSKLSENRNTSKLKDHVILLRYARLLHKLEQDLSKSTDMTTTNHAVFYREKAFHLLDWLPSLLGFADHAVACNTLLQIGITLQRAAAQEPNPVLSMADEKIATRIYDLAVCISHRATPNIELYTCLHSVKCLSCRYTDSEYEETLKALHHRALWLADLFPFFQDPQSNADFSAPEDSTLVLMRQLLHALIEQIDSDKDSEKRDAIDHSYVRVVYQAYEACLKNWYDENHDAEREKNFRELLMKELLLSKQWKTDDISYNLNAPWPLSDLDEQGWTSPKSSILSSAKELNIPTYKTLLGAEINYESGELNFILDSCEDNESDNNRLLTFFDLSELYQRRLTSAIFSLDPADPDMPYHPFNKMRFKPSTLYHSQLLNTLLLTDYSLKFLTVGQEVQRRDPYELRCLDSFTSKLPDHLKKVIYDFNSSNHDESYSRFWIESEAVELAIDDEDMKKNGNVLFALGNIRMVVKHRKMVRDSEGNLVDKTGENEGWDCYILTQEQEQELYSGKRVISDSAIIIIRESWNLIFWEYNKTIHRLTLEEEKSNLISLSERQRDSQEKVKTDDSESLRQIYRIVLKAADKTNMPHNYSPEFIFAQEFTKYYDEFAIYFPEFGRLRELSKAVCLVNILTEKRVANIENIHLIRRLLNYKQFCGLENRSPWQVVEHEYWQTTRQKLKEFARECITKQFEEWRAISSKEKIEQERKESLRDLRRQIAPLKFTRNSPEIKEICDKFYDDIKSNIVAEHGYFFWWFKASGWVYKEVIEPQIPGLIANMEARKKEACQKKLLELFEDELSDLSRLKASQLVEKFLEDDDEPLHEQLVDYDRTQVAKLMKKVYPEHSINILDEALNNDLSAINKVVDCETEKALKEHEQQLKVLLSGREKLEKTFTDLGFGDDTEEIKLEETCLWVPASFRHDAEKGRTRTVYGGVCITGLALKSIDRNRVRALIRQTRADAIRLQENNIRGTAANNFYAELLRISLSSNPKLTVKTEYPVKTPYGLRKLDIVILKEGEDDKLTPIAGFELKTANTRFIKKQRMKDAWIRREKEGKYPTFPITEIRVDVINKNHCKIQ